MNEVKETKFFTLQGFINNEIIYKSRVFGNFSRILELKKNEENLRFNEDVIFKIYDNKNRICEKS